MPKKTPLVTAALALGLSYHRLRNQVLRGQVHGGQDEFGRWYVLTRVTKDGQTRLIEAKQRR